MSYNVTVMTLCHITSQGDVKRGDLMPPSNRHLPSSLVGCRVGIRLGGSSNNGVIIFLIQEVFPPTGGEGGINYDDPLGFIVFKLM